MLNKVMLIGHLGRDPEMRYTSGGLAVANFSLATNETWSGKDGQKETRTEWHRIVAFGRLGEVCGEYLTKGKLVYIEGRLQTREWEDRDGNKRSTTEIVASNMQMLSSRGAPTDSPGDSDRYSSGAAPERKASPQPQAAPPGPPSSHEPSDDDIPF